MDQITILLVEDHPVTRKLVRGILERAGFAVREAKDGQAARTLMAERPRIVLQDLSLPDVDGQKLSRELRALGDGTAFIALVDMASDLAGVGVAEFDDVIEKPVDAPRLLARIAAWLAAGSSARNAHAPAEQRGRCVGYAAELGVLTSLSAAVLEGEDVEHALSTTLSTCIDACGCSLGALYLLDRHRHLRVRTLGAYAGDAAEFARFFGHEAFLRDALERGASIELLADAHAGAGELPRALSGIGAVRALILPLTYGGAALGALFMAARATDPPVALPVLRAFGEGIATQAAAGLALARALREREQAERAAEQQRRLACEQTAMLRALVDHAPDIVMQLEPSGRLLFINRAPAGTTVEALRAGSWLDLALPEYHQAMRDALAKVVREGAAVTLETSQVNDRGTVLWTQSHLGPIREGSEVVGVLVIQRDVSAQKQTEAQLLVADRLASVGGLAAGLVHEINNPLASVVANLELGLHEAEQLTLLPHSELVEGLRDAREAADRVRRIVQDLRIFARADETSRGPVDVARLLESVLRLSRNEIHYRARLVKRFERDVPPVYANEAQLGQVFLNLTLSAVYAIEEGAGVHRELVVEVDRDGPEHVAVTIWHAGDGVAPAGRSRRPSPFAKAPGLGTGLGLALCHRIVSELGGTIAFDDSQRNGARYRVVLPAGQFRASAASDVPRALARARRGAVLVIDDERPIIDVVRRILTSHYDVVGTERAAEALRCIHDGARFDAILCDLMMPSMSGMDFYEAVARAYPEQAGRIIFVSGGAFAPNVRHFLERLPNKCLNKPIDGTQLRSTIDEMVP